ncbi:ferredoxin [Halocella sp. SP3-1]|uniref:ferredoxin n=1 Tax=Halocella sp. SP3-1 TaxID=2382161 RepID=UPI000F75CACA|nr:ferredoxin [Halocella sp. SP3-1]AZO95662.1 ferredoxin [Halocella sp. SP3-1]
MFNIKEGYPENAVGEFFVNKACISCGKCMATAPYNFKFTIGDKHAIVDKQPVTAEEDKLCQKALNDCPVNAIEKVEI